MIVEPKPLANSTQEAIALLYQKLGVVDTVRFLNQFTNGFGNYTEERNALFADKTLDEIIDEVKQSQSGK